MREDPRILEMHFGEWEGKLWDEIPRSMLDEWGQDILNVVQPCGEYADAMTQRTNSALRDIMALPRRHGIVVTHGGPFRAIMSMLSSVTLQQSLSWQIDFGAVVQVKL
jgi:alpha-ribazole phosphatase